MGCSGGDGRGKHSESDLSAFKEAFADVKPLQRKSPKRVTPTSDPELAQIPARRKPAEPLIVEREANGIILANRGSTHSSILESLEDPRLEVEARCDLHGCKAQEAEREVHRFVRECQKNGKRWVLIIVGKGLHSPGGRGTLQGHIVEALSKRGPARFVLAFRTAPQHLGGTGALVLRLVDRL